MTSRLTGRSKFSTCGRLKVWFPTTIFYLPFFPLPFIGDIFALGISEGDPILPALNSKRIALRSAEAVAVNEYLLYGAAADQW